MNSSAGDRQAVRIHMLRWFTILSTRNGTSPDVMIANNSEMSLPPLELLVATNTESTDNVPFMVVAKLATACKFFRDMVYGSGPIT